MPGVISTNIKRVLTDGRGKINKYGENPPRTDTFFLSSFQSCALANNGDSAHDFIMVVPPDVFSQNTASTGKLTDIYISYKVTDATATYIKTLQIQKLSSGSSTTASFTAGSTGDTSAESYSGAPADFYAATSYDSDDHALASAANILLFHRPILSTATQLTVKPLDVIYVKLTYNHGATASQLAPTQVNLEFTRGSI